PRDTVLAIGEHAGHAAPGPFVDEHTFRAEPTHGVGGNPSKFSLGDVAIAEDEEWRTAMPALDRWLTTAVSAPLLGRYGYALADGAILPNLKAHPSTGAQVPFLLGGYLAATIRTARRFKPDVIHAHWLVPGGLVALAASRVLSVPYIVTVHGADAFAMRKGGL